MSFETPKTTAPKAKGKENKVTRPRMKYTEDDGKLLSKIVQTAREGKYKSIILGECSSNTEKQKAWEEIKDIFNAATGKDAERKQVRDFYNKQKGKAKKRHDTREIEKRKLKTISSTTGGGPGLMLTADVDPDEHGDGFGLEGMFSQEMDPVELGCNKLTKPGPSTSPIDDIMTDCSGTPILDSMGLPVSQLTAPITAAVLSPTPTPTTTTAVAKKALVVFPMRDLKLNTNTMTINTMTANKNSEVANKNSEATNKTSEATNKTSEATNKNSEAANKNSEAANKNSEDSQQSLEVSQENSSLLNPTPGPSKTNLEVSLDGLKKQKRKRPRKQTITQGANQFYEKTYKIQKTVARNRIRLLKKRVAREDIKIVILKKKAENMGLTLESESEPSESESSDSDDGISSDSESDEN